MCRVVGVLLTSAQTMCDSRWSAAQEQHAAVLTLHTCVCHVAYLACMYIIAGWHCTSFVESTTVIGFSPFSCCSREQNLSSRPSCSRCSYNTAAVLGMPGINAPVLAYSWATGSLSQQCTYLETGHRGASLIQCAGHACVCMCAACTHWHCC